MTLLLLVWKLKIKDAFQISLSFLFAFLGILQFVLCCLSPNFLHDNWYLLSAILLLLIESVLLFVAYIISE